MGIGIRLATVVHVDGLMEALSAQHSQRKNHLHSSFLHTRSIIYGYLSSTAGCLGAFITPGPNRLGTLKLAVLPGDRGDRDGPTLSETVSHDLALGLRLYVGVEGLLEDDELLGVEKAHVRKGSPRNVSCVGVR